MPCFGKAQVRLSIIQPEIQDGNSRKSTQAKTIPFEVAPPAASSEALRESTAPCPSQFSEPFKTNAMHLGDGTVYTAVEVKAYARARETAADSSQRLGAGPAGTGSELYEEA
ncbi:hypothetical protein BV898_08859 [Hypsibius exemplaris]|uniref:Uncharacterized protein n=1 Tax=Hypsibius exemplaris TaxID=2072580 RepID=A0A1W0WP59_HYPEX|nr:hypothetical protein BV898_08859 [Hypsibius exemplaris]